MAEAGGPDPRVRGERRPHAVSGVRILASLPRPVHVEDVPDLRVEGSGGSGGSPTGTDPGP